MILYARHTGRAECEGEARDETRDRSRVENDYQERGRRGQRTCAPETAQRHFSGRYKREGDWRNEHELPYRNAVKWHVTPISFLHLFMD